MEGTIDRPGDVDQTGGRESIRPATGLRALLLRAFGLVSLILSALGALSLFDILMPTAVRLSIIFKAATGAYSIARDFVWSVVRNAFELLHVRIPELPALWLDGITISALVFAALNFESLHRYNRTLLLDYWRAMSKVGSSIWTGQPGGLKQSLFSLMRVRSKVWSRLLSSGLMTSGWLLTGFLIIPVAFACGIDPLSLLPRRADTAWINYFVVATWVMAITGLSYMLGAVLSQISKGDRLGPLANPLNVFGRVLQLLFGLPTFCLILLMFGLVRGWRSVVLAFALVAFFAGANWVAINAIDPLINQPPQWICALANADPDAAPAPRCEQ